MQNQNKNANVHYDVIVIGAGHAGCEAAWAASRLGKNVLLTTMNLDSIAYLACNPSIGGTAKGHLVCEIDALGGLMGIIADKTAIQIRMLNIAKGAAVFSLRAQADKIKYHSTMKQTLEDIKNITIKQGEVVDILTKEICPKTSLNGAPKTKQSLPEYSKAVTGVKLSTGETFTCSAIVVATGVYLNSEILIGSYRNDSGPSGFANSKSLTQSLINLGLEIRRFKTGTPPRVNSRTIDFSKTEAQHGDDGIQTFSFLTAKPIKNQILCHITGTNVRTHQIIRENLHQSAMYAPRSGSDQKGIGARYCPSIEDKIVRFSDRDRHQIFLEPESLSTNETYLQGISTSLPPSVQQQIVHSIKGLENAQIMRDAYAIEYNCINSLQLHTTLEYKNCRGLFFAGQVNGTSGYEEAAAQGLVAGVNAAWASHFHSPKETAQSKHDMHAKPSNEKAQLQSQRFTLSRTNSYIGVLIDDLVTVGTDEPYRMFTSRAEHRLYLRQDNADLRLTPIGREIGLVCDHRWKVFNRKLRQIKKAHKLLTLRGLDSEAIASEAKTLGIPQSVIDTVQTELKYEGYIKRELVKIAEAKRCEATILPPNLDYQTVTGLSSEARTKLNKIHPQNIGQASRITGVTPADINVLLVWLKKYNH